MRNLEIILFQVDEARRYIEDGRVSQLRLALLLLDNAAEIQMELCIQNHLLHEDWRSDFRDRIRQFHGTDLSEDLKKIIEWQPLNGKERRSVERFFDEKIRFLTERHNVLDKRLAGPLSYLHRYRNEAHHRANVRQDTINTACKILLDINCQMLSSVSPGVTSYSSGEDYSWLESRFGISAARTFSRETVVKTATDDIRSRVSLSDESIAATLAANLESRIENVLESLDFAIENTRIPDRDAAIRESQRYGESQRDYSLPRGVSYNNFRERHSIVYLDQLRCRLAEISKAADKLEAFGVFSTLELEFEPVEANIHGLAAEIDHMIQMEIDRLRGK